MGDTVKLAAEQMNVSRSTVQRARKVVEEGAFNVAPSSSSTASAVGAVALRR